MYSLCEMNRLPNRRCSDGTHLDGWHGNVHILQRLIKGIDRSTFSDTRDFLFIHSVASISRKSCLVTIGPLSIHGNVGASFWWWDAFPLTNQLGLGKRCWNLETSSAVVEFPLPYL